MAGDFFSDITYNLATVLDKGFETATLLYLSIFTMVVPTTVAAAYLGLFTSLAKASAIVAEMCYEASTNAVQFLSKQLLLPEYTKWKTLDRFVGYIVTRVLFVGLAVTLSLTLALVVCPAVVLLWFTCAMLMLLAGINLKMFALQPFLCKPYRDRTAAPCPDVCYC